MMEHVDETDRKSFLISTYILSQQIELDQNEV